MPPWAIWLSGAALVVAWIGLLGLLPRLWLGTVRPGDDRAGVAIFAGGTRWFGIRWGFRTVPAGLGLGGFRGRTVYRSWHTALQGWLVLPALWKHDAIEREAQEVADLVVRLRRDAPARPVYVLGCSAGGQVALRALERLPDGVAADGAALLSAAVDPKRDLRSALAHLRGRLVVSCSPLDCIILGAGTLLFGNADGTHAPGMGMVGPHGPGAEDPRVVVVRWGWRMARTGRMGGHATATPPVFIGRYVAPALFEAPAGPEEPSLS